MKDTLIPSHTLAERWNLKPNTLGQWRWYGRGPKYLKIGRRVLYRIEDIEAFEKEKLRRSTSQVIDEKLNQKIDSMHY